MNELHKLELLDLSDNLICRILAEDVKHMPESLVTLDLSGNQLTVLKDMQNLNDLLNLSHIYIQRSKISSLKHYKQTLVFLIPTLSTIDGKDINDID